MMYLRFAPKSINTESKPQVIDLMGRGFVCKYETRETGVRHGIGILSCAFKIEDPDPLVSEEGGRRIFS